MATAEAASTSSGVSLAHTGYSVVSQPNRVRSKAQPRVIHWKKWWWVLTSPAVTRSPSTRTTSSPGSAAAAPHPLATGLAGPRPHGRDPAALDGHVPRPAGPPQHEPRHRRLTTPAG